MKIFDSSPPISLENPDQSVNKIYVPRSSLPKSFKFNSRESSRRTSEPISSIETQCSEANSVGCSEDSYTTGRAFLSFLNYGRPPIDSIELPVRLSSFFSIQRKLKLRISNFAIRDKFPYLTQKFWARIEKWQIRDFWKSLILIRMIKISTKMDHNHSNCPSRLLYKSKNRLCRPLSTQ